MSKHVACSFLSHVIDTMSLFVSTAPTVQEVDGMISTTLLKVLIRLYDGIFLMENMERRVPSYLFLIHTDPDLEWLVTTYTSIMNQARIAILYDRTNEIKDVVATAEKLIETANELREKYCEGE